MSAGRVRNYQRRAAAPWPLSVAATFLIGLQQVGLSLLKTVSGVMIRTKCKARERSHFNEPLALPARYAHSCWTPEFPMKIDQTERNVHDTTRGHARKVNKHLIIIALGTKDIPLKTQRGICTFLLRIKCVALAKIALAHFALQRKIME